MFSFKTTVSFRYQKKNPVYSIPHLLILISKNVLLTIYIRERPSIKILKRTNKISVIIFFGIMYMYTCKKLKGKRKKGNVLMNYNFGTDYELL